jgi:hypothetical protein
MIMNAVSKAVASAMLGCSGILMCGCVSSSTLVDVWHDPSFTVQPLGKVLVVAVRKDSIKRRIWEDAFVGELAKHRVAAESSYDLFPGAPPDTDQIIATVNANGFDGILAILLLPTETDKRFVQGYSTQIQDVRYSPYWNRYWTFYRDIDHPGYTDSQTVDIRAIEVTTTGKGGRLIWSATSRTSDPGSVANAQRGIAGLVISELTRRSIIGSKR